MSAIGEYVHYWRNHYLTSGISHLGEGSYQPYNFGSWTDQYVAFKIKNQQSNYDLSSIENSLNYIFSTDNDDQIIGDSTVGEIHKAAEDAIQEAFSEPGKVNWNSGDVVSHPITSREIEEQKSIILSRIRSADNDINRQINTIYQRISSIETIMGSIKNQSTQANLQSQILKIKQTFFEFLDTTEANLQNLLKDTENKITFSQYFKQKGFENNDLSTLSSLIGDLNNALKIARGTRGSSLTAQKGYLGEYVTTALKGMVLKQAENDIENVTKEALITKVNLTGKNQETATVSMDKLSKNFDASSIGWEASGDGYSWKMSSSLQKVDAELILNNDENNKLSLSVKNINLYSGFDINIVSSSPLLNLLVNQDGDFVNHYLNLVSTHAGAKGGDLGTQLSAAREAVKMVIFWQALSGIEGRKQADVFVMINNKDTNRPVQVYDMSTLAEKAISDFNNYVDITTDSGGSIDNLYFENKWHPSSSAGRISQLLIDVHATKISVGLKPSIFI